MAKKWFEYTLINTARGPQLTASSYAVVGPYPGINSCLCSERTCLIYSFYSSTSPELPADRHLRHPLISTNLQTYIISNTTAGNPVIPRPEGNTKKYVYVKGS